MARTIRSASFQLTAVPDPRTVSVHAPEETARPVRPFRIRHRAPRAGSASAAWRLWPTWALVLSGAPAALHAHDPGLSTAQGRMDLAGFHLVVNLAARETERLAGESTASVLRSPTTASLGGSTSRLAPAARPMRASRKPAADGSDRWQAIARSWCSVRCDGAAIPPARVRLGRADGSGLEFQLDYPPLDGSFVKIAMPRLAELPRGHREFVVVTDAHERVVAEKFLTGDDATLKFAVPTPGRPMLRPESAPGLSIRGFLRLGIAHIWTGYDHILFLLGLLVVCRSFRSVTSITACFTLAHSLTLAAATLDLVHLPGRLVEPAIAASIVFVGIENLVRRGAEPRGRSALTFCFGLIHGFGFATALRDLGIGSSPGEIALPLVTFNLGVELGQLAIAAVVLPLVWRLRRNRAFVRLGVPALSGLIAAVGAYWFLARTVLPGWAA